MDESSIMRVFVSVMGWFQPFVTVVLGIVVSIIGLRWIISIFTKN